MAADASGNRGQLPDPMARLHPPAVSEKLVRVFASEELSQLGRAARLVLPACCAATAPVPVVLAPAVTTTASWASPEAQASPVMAGR